VRHGGLLGARDGCRDLNCEVLAGQARERVIQELRRIVDRARDVYGKLVKATRQWLGGRE